MKMHNLITTNPFTEMESGSSDIFYFNIDGDPKNKLIHDYRVRIRFVELENEKYSFYMADNSFTCSYSNHIYPDGKFCIFYEDDRYNSNDYFESCLTFVYNQCYRIENGFFPKGTELSHNFLLAIFEQYNTITKMRIFLSNNTNKEDVILKFHVFYLDKDGKKFTKKAKLRELHFGYILAMYDKDLVAYFFSEIFNINFRKMV